MLCVSFRQSVCFGVDVCLVSKFFTKCCLRMMYFVVNGLIWKALSTILCEGVCNATTKLTKHVNTEGEIE